MNTINLGKSLGLSALIAISGASGLAASAADFRFVEGAGYMDLFTSPVPKDKPVTYYFRTMILDVDKFPSPTQAVAQALYDEYAKSSPSVSISIPGRAIGPKEVARHRAGRLWITDSRQGGINALEAAGVPAWEAFGLQGRRASAGIPLAPGAMILRETFR